MRECEGWGHVGRDSSQCKVPKARGPGEWGTHKKAFVAVAVCSRGEWRDEGQLTGLHIIWDPTRFVFCLIEIGRYCKVECY